MTVFGDGLQADLLRLVDDLAEFAFAWRQCKSPVSISAVTLLARRLGG
jgi:hypothetical protein